MMSGPSGSAVGCPRPLLVRRPVTRTDRRPAWGLVVRCGNFPTPSPHTRTSYNLHGPLRRNQIAMQGLEDRSRNSPTPIPEPHRQKSDREKVRDTQWCRYTEKDSQSRPKIQSHGDEMFGRFYLSCFHLLLFCDRKLNGLPEIEPEVSRHDFRVALLSPSWGIAMTLILIIQHTVSEQLSAPAGLERAVSNSIVFERILETHQRKLITCCASPCHSNWSILKWGL